MKALKSDERAGRWARWLQSSYCVPKCSSDFSFSLPSSIFRLWWHVDHKPKRPQFFVQKVTYNATLMAGRSPVSFFIHSILYGCICVCISFDARAFTITFFSRCWITDLYYFINKIEDSFAFTTKQFFFLNRRSFFFAFIHFKRMALFATFISYNFTGCWLCDVFSFFFSSISWFTIAAKMNAKR